MSDHNERMCRKCGSLLHHEDDCLIINKLYRRCKHDQIAASCRYCEKEQLTLRNTALEQDNRRLREALKTWGDTDYQASINDVLSQTPAQSVEVLDEAIEALKYFVFHAENGESKGRNALNRLQRLRGGG